MTVDNILGIKPGFKFIDLFAGVGGFRTALDRLGGKCVFSSEIDPHAKVAYKTLYGESPAGDIRKVNAKDIPDFDVLCGGFPCQTFSVAGKKLGFKDKTRGTLFFEIARIAEAKKPKVLFLENVKGLVNHDKGRTLDVIVKTLSDLGYTVDFEVLNSKFFGVPQNRERVFFIAIYGHPTEPFIIPKRNTVCTQAKKRFNNYKDVRTFNFSWPTNDRVTSSIKDILEPVVDEKFYLSEDKTSKLIRSLNEKPNSDIKSIGYIERTNQGNRVYRVDGVSPTITSVGGGIGGHGSGVYAVPYNEDIEKPYRISDKRGGKTLHSWDMELYGALTDEEKQILETIRVKRRKGGKEVPLLPSEIGCNKEKLDKLVEMGYLKEKNGLYDFSLTNFGFDVNCVIPPNGIAPTLTGTDAVRNAVLYNEEQAAANESTAEVGETSNIDLKSIMDFMLYHGIAEVKLANNRKADIFNDLVNVGFLKKTADNIFSLDIDGMNTEDNEMHIVGMLDMKGNDQVKRVYDPMDIAPTLTTAVQKESSVKEFSQGEGIACCLDANYGNGISANSVGKGRRTHVIEEVRAVLTPDRDQKRQNGRRFKEADEPSFTLTSQDIHGVALKYGEYNEDGSIINTRTMGDPSVHQDVSPTLCATDYKEPKLVHHGWRIRKLTPLECFRLQGFPDHYVQKLVDIGLSNTQLYKMAGNAVTVNVIEAVMTHVLNFTGVPRIKEEAKTSVPAVRRFHNGVPNEKQTKFVDAFVSYATNKKLDGKYTSSELYEGLSAFAESNGIELIGVQNSINMGTLLGLTVEYLMTRGVEVVKNSKNWTINCHVEQLQEATPDIHKPSVSLVDVMDKFLGGLSVGVSLKTSDLYNEVKAFADKNGIECDGLSNSIFFGTCLNREVEALNKLGYKISKDTKKWKIEV